MSFPINQNNIPIHSVPLNEPDSVNNLSVTDFAVKKRKWEDLEGLIAADKKTKTQKNTLTSYCYKPAIFKQSRGAWLATSGVFD